MPDNFKKEIIEFLNRKWEEEVQFLAELVKVPSDNPPGDCVPHAERTTALLEALGLTVEKYPVPEELVKKQGMTRVTNLIVRQRFDEGPIVALNAHGDVVPPGEGWTVDPYGAEIREETMYGRGVAVSKSDFATYTYALLALKAVQAPLRGSVELHFTYDEEAGGEVGPKWLLEQGISKPDFVISAGFSYAVVTAHNGCLHLEVQVKGKSAHAARPDTGYDALEATTAILTALYEHRKSYTQIHSQVEGIDSPTLVVGLIHGGINTNVVPDLITFRLDRRIIPEEDGEKVERTLTSLIEQTAASFPGITVQVKRILLAKSFRQVPGSEKLLKILICNASEVLGEKICSQGVPIYTDARHYAAMGIPTVMYGAGPRSLLEANAHRANERLKLDDLKKATRVVALTLLDLLQETYTSQKSE
jgi:acetylornithine deacetylase/succinyl-diaminopimelate desuccinylase family protein